MRVVHGDFNSVTQQQVLREMEILQRMDSLQVVQYKGFFQMPFGEVAILMEYMELGSLDAILKSKGTFSEGQLGSVAC